MRHAAMLGLISIAALGAVPASANVLITVDKSTQTMDVSVDGMHRWTWPVSTGVLRYDTPNGTFHPVWMDADHRSKEWDNAPMPHSIFFTKVGNAIHGELDTRYIGSPASHGCVRLTPPHAAELYDLVDKQGIANTTIVLKGDVRVALAHRGTRVASRDVGADVMSGPPQSLQPDGYGAPRSAYDDDGQPSGNYGYQQQYGYRQPQYAYQQPQYGSQQLQYGSRARYGRTYDNCPLPPPGFPTPACARERMRGAEARAAQQYPPRRYDYGQPQYEPEQPSSFFGRSPYGY